MKNKTNSKDISVAIIAGYVGEFIEDFVARFLHDYTNTKYIQVDFTPGIISSVAANVTLELMGDTNVIYSSFLAGGLIYAIISQYNEIVKKEEVDYNNLVYRFIFDSSLITIVLYFYKKFLEYIKKYQKKHYEGILNQLIKDVIRALPISIYFGYRQFIGNLNEQKEGEEDSEKCSKK